MQVKINLNIVIFILLFLVTGQIELYGILMLFALIHESGHLLVGGLLKWRPSVIHIMPLGLSICFHTNCEDYNRKIGKGNLLSLKKIVIAAAGPVTNLICILFFAFVPISLLGINSTVIIYSNILIALFNLLPIYPLDGGRILKHVIQLTIGKKQAQEISTIVNNISVMLVTIFSSFAIIYFKNIAILLIVIYLWILLIIQNKKDELKKKIYEQIEKERKQQEKRYSVK